MSLLCYFTLNTLHVNKDKSGFEPVIISMLKTTKVAPTYHKMMQVVGKEDQLLVLIHFELCYFLPYSILWFLLKSGHDVLDKMTCNE